MAINRPPQFLNRDKRLRDGYQFLQEFGQLINLEVILARHGNEDESTLGDEQFGFENRVRASDIYLLEGLGYTNQTETTLNKLSNTGQADEHVKEWIGQSLHCLRQAQAIQGSDVTIGFFDIDDHPDEHHIRQSLIKVSELYHSIDTFEGDERGKNKLEWIHTLAFEAMREWFMIGNIGLTIAAMCQEDPKLLNKLSVGTLKVIMTAGESHGDIARKLRLYGVKVSESHPVKKEGGDLQNTMFQKWIEQGYISNEDLERLVAE
jgi:hypothetical protein